MYKHIFRFSKKCKNHTCIILANNVNFIYTAYLLRESFLLITLRLESGSSACSTDLTSCIMRLALPITRVWLKTYYPYAHYKHHFSNSCLISDIQGTSHYFLWSNKGDCAARAIELYVRVLPIYSTNILWVTNCRYLVLKTWEIIIRYGSAATASAVKNHPTFI